MPSNEDLYREMEERGRWKVSPMKQEKPVRREVDVMAAMGNFNRDIRPVIENIKKIQAGVPLSRNPLKNLYLKLTGKSELVIPEAVEPTVDPVIFGKNSEETRKEIIENLEEYRHLSKAKADAKPVNATRKTAADLHRK